MDTDVPEDVAMEEQKARKAAQAMALFVQFDADGSGTLDKQEVRLLLESQGLSVSTDYLQGLLDVFDKDKNGEFDTEEFAALAAVVSAPPYALLQPRRWRLSRRCAPR